MARRNRRRNVRTSLPLRVALTTGACSPWLDTRDSEVPRELAPEPTTLQRARRKLPKAAQRTVSLSTGGLGVTTAAGSDIMPHDRVMALLALGA
ncbi:MAG: hypothetical protein ABEJ96_07585, partial [Thiohalorhabdaceae bacterium]